jgi:hypothetical protein
MNWFLSVVTKTAYFVVRSHTIANMLLLGLVTNQSGFGTWKQEKKSECLKDIQTGFRPWDFLHIPDTLSLVLKTPSSRFKLQIQLSSFLQVWDCVSGEEVETLRGHAGMILACRFSPDGKFIVSGINFLNHLSHIAYSFHR